MQEAEYRIQKGRVAIRKHSPPAGVFDLSQISRILSPNPKPLLCSAFSILIPDYTLFHIAFIRGTNSHELALNVLEGLLRRESSALRQENSALKQESSALRQESSALKQESSALKQECSALRRESSALRQESCFYS